MELRPYIRESAGKNRCDLSSLLADARAFRTLVEQLAAPFAAERVTHVAGIDAMGFILGGAVAVELGAGFVPLRKPGKAAWEVRSVQFSDYSGIPKSLELVVDILRSDSRVLIVDDWAETGAQLRAASELCSSTGATVVGAAVLNADPVVRQRPPDGIRILHSVIAY
jgi:adenine phosphoribosyltransferase